MSTHVLRRQRLLLRRYKIRLLMVVGISFLSMPIFAPIWLLVWFTLVPQPMHGNAPLMGVGAY